MYRNYNTAQTSISLNLNFDIPNNHIVRLIDMFVDTIPYDIMETSFATTGRPAYHPAMLMKMVLFAYSRKVFSGRRIVEMNDENIPMKWLSQDTTISYKTINNFRSSKEMSDLIKLSFIYFTKLLADNNMIEDQALFIDGTKIEADANKYSFTWKRAVEKFHPILKDKITYLYEELIEDQVIKEMDKEYLTSSAGLAEILIETQDEIDHLDQVIEEEPQVIKGGSKNRKRRRKLKKLARKMKEDYLPRTQKYEEAERIFDGRNSFSKTDRDATFMRMKEDPVMNGQLKPGNNLQIATNGQFILNYGIFPNLTDMRTLVPFLSNMHSLVLFQYIVADVDYGSESNYAAVIDAFEKIPLIPYGMYEKEQKRKFKNDPTKIHNWKYSATDDYYTDHLGVKFSFKRYSIRHDKYGYERKFKIYEADKTQETAILDKLAKTPKERQRQVAYNPNWDYFKNCVKDLLSTDMGSEIYSRRKCDVEPVFGRMKSVFGVRRTHLRGQQAVENELGLLLLTMNLTKLAEILTKAATKFQHEQLLNMIKQKNGSEILIILEFRIHFSVTS